MEASIAEEEYIDMDVSSAALTRPPSPSPPPLPQQQPRDFEFQMSGKPLPEMDGITSPADELFYEGKLLPLHLPLRVDKQLLLPHDSSTPATETNANADAAATPYYSCNASPATSCYVSGELDPESYFFSDECRTEEPAQPHAGGTSWAKKLRLIKQSSSLSRKLKASRAYLKSLFARSGCSDESCAVPKAKERPSGRQAKKNASSSLRRVDAAEKMAAAVVVEEEGRGHRRSFSGAIKRRGASTSTTTSSSSNSSSFSSVNSNNNGPQVLKRGSSGSSEAECSIQGAIAYCKKSQQEVRARNTASDVVQFYAAAAAAAAALSASRIAADCEKQERPEICRG